MQCEEDLPPTIQESEASKLADLKSEIEDIANASICDDAFECQYIAFGSKPCGGPWSYLIYSTSIDTEKLKNMVEGYNQKETLFNTKWSICSDCSIANSPSDIICENNKCVAIN